MHASSRNSLPLVKILACLAVALAACANRAEASRFFISTSSTSVALTNPIMVVAPNTTSTFYVYYQETTGDQIYGMSHAIVSSNPIISRSSYTIEDPTVLGTTRWANPPDSGTSGGTFLVQDANATNSPSNLGTGTTLDPTYDASSGTYRVSTLVYTANQTGSTQIRLGVGSLGIAFNESVNPNSMFNFGFGDAAISGHSFGATSTIADATITVMTVDAAHPYHDTNLATDVNGDGSVTPIDALLTINALNAMGTGHQLTVPAPPGSTPPFIDVNGDGLISPTDALQVINALNANVSKTASFTSAISPGESADNLLAGDSLVYSTAVPEPSTFALATPAAGVLLWLLARRKRRA